MSTATYTEIIGYVIKTFREQQNKTQSDMAVLMGLTQAAWSKLEAGSSALSIAQMAKVAEKLNISVKEITDKADEIMEELKNQGVEITSDKKEASNLGLALLGGAAIAGLAALMMARKK